jgi:DNA polymerase III subunit delta'
VSWERLRGHEARVEQFTRAVRRGRLAHAYLFIGPPGVGKRLFAVELAKALLCEAAPQSSPLSLGGRGEGVRGREALTACDHCPACVQIDAGTHPDFRVAGRPAEASEFPIDVMRDLCQGFSLKSARGRGKVVVIDDADDLNEESANCFLKTLEEPPPGSVLILIGTGTDRQRATITSRCQAVRFRPLPPEVVDELLRKQGVDDAALRARLVRLGGGSPGQALALAEPELWTFRRTLLEGLAKPRIDAVGLAKAWVEFAQDAGKEAVHQRRRARLVLRLLIEFLGDVLSERLERPGRGVEADDRTLVEAFAGRADADQVLALQERCLEADFQIERNVQTALALEALLDSFAASLAPGQQVR